MLSEYQTERLILKMLKPDEASMVLDFYNRDKALFEQYEFERALNFYSIEYQKKVLTYEYGCFLRQTLFRYYVFLKEDPSVVIGTVCIHDISRSFYQNCEIGYKFSSAYHHKGYASEALSLVNSLVFNDLKLHRIEAYVCSSNEPSRVLLSRLGYKEEGLLQEYLYIQNHWSDHYLYALTCTKQK